jgi:plastocyanin
MSQYISGRQPFLNVGIPGITTNTPVLDITGRVGIGTTNPSADLDLSTLRIRQSISDVNNFSGELGYFLSKDAVGLKWVGVSAVNNNALFVAQNSVFSGVSSYTGLNFISDANDLVAISTNINPNIVDVKINSYWIKSGNTGIYTSKFVGIGSTTPTVALDVIGGGKFTGVVTAGKFSGQSGIITGNVEVGSFIVTGISTFVGVTTFSKVGIGSTTIPRATLDVGGDVWVSGALTAISITADNFFGTISTSKYADSAGFTTSISLGSTTSTDDTSYLVLVGSSGTTIQQAFIDSQSLSYDGQTNTLNSDNIKVGFITATNAWIGVATINDLKVVNDTFRVGTAITMSNGIITATTFKGKFLDFDNLRVSGVSTFTNGTVFISTTTSTGTSNQPLQVVGSAYVSGNIGLGSTNPTSKLFVVGDGYFTGVITASEFKGNASTATYATDAGIATNVIGGIASVTSLFVNTTGISTFGGSNGVVIKLDGSNGIVTSANPGFSTVTYYGDGSKLTGIGTATSATNVALTTDTSSTTTNIVFSQSPTQNPTSSLKTNSGLIFNAATSSLGIGTTNPTSKLWVGGDGYFVGVITATKFSGQLDATSAQAQSVGFATTAINLANGDQGSLPYQNSSGITSFLSGGSNNQVLIYDTGTNKPKWGPVTGTGAISGIDVKDEDSTSVSGIKTLNFRGRNITAVSDNVSGISTITVANDYDQDGATSAYATKRVLQYNETTKAVTYSNTLDAVRAYITGYGPEIHVSPVAFDDTGNGTIGDPVKTIAQAQVLAALAFETTGIGERKTIILHPGDYAENVTINTQFTVLTTHELVGKNTTLSGTLTITKGCTIDGLKMNNLVISATSATGSVDIIGCTVSTATTKTSSAYTNFRACDLSTSTLSITGTGTVILVGGNYFTVTVNNAAAGVLSKAVVSMGPVTLTAGTLQISDTLVYSATNTSNAITQSAGSVLTLNNSQTLIPSLTNVARNSFGGFYSILHSVYDKPNSTFGGTSLNAISYSQYINADKIGIGTTNATSNLYVVGDGYFVGVITATKFSGQLDATSAQAQSVGFATTAINLANGTNGNVPYQSSSNTTAFVTNGISGQVLLSNGNNAPSWGNVSAASGSFGGISVQDEGAQVGTGSSITTLNFVGSNIQATATSGASGIATITMSDTLVGTALSISGISTISGVKISSGIVSSTTGTSVTFYGDFVGTASSAGYATTAFNLNGTIESNLNVAYASTAGIASAVKPNSVGLGTDTTGDYVRSISGTSNQITVSATSGEGSTPTLSIPNQFTVPQDATVIRDLQVNRDLNVTGNITIGGTSAFLDVQRLQVSDADIILGFRTDAFGNDISNDTTANHGGIAIASTEGNPLVRLVAAGIETLPTTYKKIMWFKAGSFAGLGTDAWLFNYGVGIGSTQFPSGTRLAVGSVQFTENDLVVVRDINATGVITATKFVGSVGFATTATNLANGSTGNVPYQSSPNTTAFVTNGSTGQVLISNGNAAPSWGNVSGAQGSFSGITVRDENTQVGTGSSITTLNFVGSNIQATATSGASGIATITISDNIVGTSLSISGISTFNSVRISSGIVSSTDGTAVTFIGNLTGTASYATSAGIATYATSAGIATYATSAGIATYATNAGIATYATNAGIATYATNAGIATYATNAGIATYATSAGIATYATNAGIATYATNAGIATYATNAGIATYATSAGIATYATNAGIATYATSAGIATYATNAGIATYATNAGIATYTSEWILDAVGSSDYTFTGPGFTGAENDPVLYLVRGQQYKFTNTMGAHPFRIQSTVNGSAGTEYNDGITNNNVINGTLTWNVQFDAPGLLYYQCTAHSGMGGKIYIIDAGIGSDISINTTGIITATSFVGTALSISGISTFGGSNGVVIKSDGSNGIVTSANPGVSTVTYYGDGSKLTGLTAGVSISTNTTNQSQYLTYVTGTGTTTGFGITTTGLVFNPSSGNLSIGSATPTSKLTVQGNVLISGVTTSGITRISSSTASPNASTPVATLEAVGASTDYDIAIVPKGNGAIVANIPDGTSVGGNKRGTYAVDFQLSRSVATHVASGENSFIGNGHRNTASGNYSAVLNGSVNTSSATHAAISGGNYNTASGDYSFIGGGQSNSANGSLSSIVGGEGNNTQTSDHSIIAGGSWSSVNGSHTSILCASYSLASRKYSSVISGHWGDTRNTYGAVVFSGANDSFGSGFTPGGGYQQSRLAILSKATTDATPSTLTADGNVYDTNNVLQVVTKSAYLVKGSVIAYSDASDLARAWEFTAVIKRASGDPSLVGTPIINDIAYDSGASGWNLSITADAATSSLKVEVTGQASTTIRWVTKMDATEVAFQ